VKRVLVVGARKGSLGKGIAAMLDVMYNPPAVDEEPRWDIVTSGISGDENLPLNLVESRLSDLTELLGDVAPEHVVCTAGINHPREAYPSLPDWYAHHYAVNCVGPMRLLEAWASMLDATKLVGSRHFVAISSNSAHIARQDSGAYCASKAGLSMALRVRAREMAGEPVVIYGYEPGLLRGTPMTEEIRSRFPGAFTRMKGLPNGMLTHQLARMVAQNLVYGGLELNGCLLRVDAGEQ
jgi:NAD(P)-dependent dehydrogenase (short-subunit alcohol dehydrogenase family)